MSCCGCTETKKAYRHNENAAPVRHLTKISDFTASEIDLILKGAIKIKADSKAYRETMKDKTLLMLFQKPSLRTRVSFEVGMTELGGHAIFYSIADSPLGKKETYSDTANVLSRFCNVVMARVNSRKDITEMCKHSTIPIINALDDWAHPCQMLCDLQTIREKKGEFKGLKMAYFGDCQNNVTYDLMRAACITGMHINVAGPKDAEFLVDPEVIKECDELSKKYGGTYAVHHDAKEAMKGVDIVYCDSWMSYTVPAEQKAARTAKLMPFQVDSKLMALAKENVIFMNCLPACRGAEQTADVIDNPKWSIVFDQAENRLHAQKALLLFLCNGPKSLEEAPVSACACGTK